MTSTAIAITEKVFQAQVQQLARSLGYRVYHTQFSFRSERGYPDLHMVKPGRSVFAELKSAKGKVSPAQEEWLAALREAGHEAYLWRPDDWDALVDVLMTSRVRAADSKPEGLTSPLVKCPKCEVWTQPCEGGRK